MSRYSDTKPLPAWTKWGSTCANVSGFNAGQPSKTMALDTRASWALWLRWLREWLPTLATRKKMEPGTSGCQGRRYCTCGLTRYIKGKLALGRVLEVNPGTNWRV